MPKAWSVSVASKSRPISEGSMYAFVYAQNLGTDVLG
jgi:hypothetical protein